MAIKRIVKSYATDPETERILKELTGRLNMSKSKAIRAAVKLMFDQAAGIEKMQQEMRREIRREFQITVESAIENIEEQKDRLAELVTI